MTEPDAPIAAAGGDAIAAAPPPWRARTALAQALLFCRAAALPLIAAQILSAFTTPLLLASAAHSWPLALAGLLCVLVSGAWTYAVLYRIGLEFWTDGNVGLGGAVRTASTRLVPFAWTVLLQQLGMLLGFVLLVVPGILFTLNYCLLGGAVPSAEASSGWAALRRNRALTDGIRARTVLALLGLSAVAIAIAVAAGVINALLVEGGGTAQRLAGALLVGIVSALFTPALIGLQTWIYTRQTGAQPYDAQRAPLHGGVAVAALAAVTVVAVGLTPEPREIVKSFWAPSGAMQPTIQIGDHFFVDRAAYRVRHPLSGEWIQRGTPQRGDVVVFTSPVDPTTQLIKRVIALPGDRFEIRDKQVLLNGTPLDEPYATFGDPNVSATGPRDRLPEMTVPPGQFIALGDNRDRSYDSRFWGPAKLDDVLGRAAWIYWSRDPDSGEIRWARFGRQID